MTRPINMKFLVYDCGDHISGKFTRFVSMSNCPAIYLTFLIGSLVWCLGVSAAPTRVTLQTTPDGGIQPQAVMDARGALHLVYFKGDAAHGDAFYVCQATGEKEFSRPIQVNTQAGSVLAVGSVRGATLAVGKNGRAHVAWMGSSQAAPALLNSEKHTPMIYTRMNDAGTSFEPERNVLTWAPGLDGGGCVAADVRGNVYVAWHAGTPDNTKGEAGRAVFVARSADEGKTFTREFQASPPDLGACGCCGMRALATDDGRAWFLFRAASGGTDRDMTLLVGDGRGAKFNSVALNQWKLNMCPMSTPALAALDGGVAATWEGAGQVGFSLVDSTGKATRTVTPAGVGKRKHPVIARNRDGDILLAWTENTGWQRGGSFAWQLFDRDGKPVNDLQTSEGVPVWGLVAVAAKPDGEFVLFH